LINLISFGLYFGFITILHRNKRPTRVVAKMPGEVIDRPNPKALPSHIPENVLELAVQLEKLDISEADLTGLEEFRRASNYIAVGKSSLWNLEEHVLYPHSYDLLE
jgi:hypothetical protein